MADIILKQTQKGAEIQRTIANFNKDSEDRKRSRSYFEVRLQRLDEAWHDFQEGHDQLEASDLPPEHDYFEKDYYGEIKRLHDKYRRIFMDAIKAFGIATVQAPEAAQVKMPVDASEGKEVERNIRRQRALTQSLKRLVGSLDRTTDDQPTHYYEVSMTTLRELWSQIAATNLKIWEISSDPIASGYDFEEYLHLEDEVRKMTIGLSSRLTGRTASEPHAGRHTAQPMPVQLPTISIPKFDGDYAKWRQFADLFEQLVHVQNIGNCQKMWYLKTNLTGDAEKLVRHLPLSNENYHTAWELLHNRYENKRLLVTTLIRRLVSQSNVGSDASSAAIKALHDTTCECLLGLENLGLSIESWDPILLHILSNNLDKSTHLLYEQSLENPKGLQSMKHFLEFLQTRFQTLEALGLKTRFTNERQQTRKETRILASVVSGTLCVVCHKEHPLYACNVFLSCVPAERIQIVGNNNLCLNCLKPGHRSNTCEGGTCRKCARKHNTLLHLPDVSTKGTITGKIKQPKAPSSTHLKQPEQAIALAAQGNRCNSRYVLLSTARVILVSENGREVECRALLDSGSQVNLISNRIIKKLGVAVRPDAMHIQGIGSASQRTQRRVNLELKSRTTGFCEHFEAFVLDQIVPPQPTQSINPEKWGIPRNVTLADPEFHMVKNIDVLIGAEFFYQILAVGQIKLASGLPTLQTTVFGWIVSGNVSVNTRSEAVCGVGVTQEQLSDSIEKFWKIEEITNIASTLSTSEKACERHFNETIQRLPSGRFMTALPFARSPDCLGNSKDMALRRFYALEKKLAKDDKLRQQYIQFMEDYYQMGHMEEVDIKNIKSPHYFLPHHSVMKPDSSTTKLRVVFDASAKTSANISLNDILLVGPTVQSELLTILLRFRLPRYVFTADIQQMYRQVLIRPSDRNFQLIFWRRDVNQPIKCYQLSTVTYGTASAPYLATKALQRLAFDERNSYPEGSKVLARDFYVDDVITGFNTLSEAITAQSELISMLEKAGFKLRKWCTNHPRLLQNIPPAEQEVQLNFSERDNEAIKTLGVSWLPKVDQLRIRTHFTDHQRVTKRIMASEIARLFDPLGLVAPVITRAKIMLQQLWQLHLDWDAAVPQEIHTQWTTFSSRLNELDSIQIPRHVILPENATKIQIHIFADASEQAYGAAVYIRSTSRAQTIVRLLCAKSRVAPIKKLTVPRLELCAAKLAADLAERVTTDLKLETTKVTLWTDSQIVLAWVHSEAANYNTFVANRISSIRETTTPQQWRHVGSKDNPADVISRGISPEKLPQCHLWFYGPRFLHGDECLWPPPFQPSGKCSIEAKNLLISAATVKEEGSFIDKINHKNSFQKLLRIIAYALRFISKIKRHPQTTIIDNHLTTQEIDDGLQVIVKEMQKQEFKEEIDQLRKHKQVDKRNRISSLAPFLDDKGILRVGGRLKNSALQFDAKHQMLIPYSHPVTRLLMEHIHRENFHAGITALLADVRQRFWPLNAKTLARSVVHSCIQCARSKPQMLQQVMGDLPATRVQPARPFVHSGVDFCGPLSVHYKIRGKRPHKCYLAVFCCFSTKAVHLELVSDLTTDAFIGALKRFMARRGRCKELYCDNATNFVGASNKLHELVPIIHSEQSQEAIKSMCVSKGVNFNFIPPRTPHFGGLWEAAVKSAKKLLKQNLASASLTYEELETVVVEIEAILNSRPLTPMSTSPNDLNALTPGHFLVGEPLTTPVDVHADRHKTSLLTRWKLVSHTKHEFWRRWSREYLSELQHRRKWKTPSPNVTPDTMVIVQEDNTPVLHWPLGRIVKTYPGEDGYVRVVDVRTASGILRRPIHKLAPLPCDGESVTDDESFLDKIQMAASTIDPPMARPAAARSHQDQHDIPPKKRRVVSGPALLSLLLTLLVLPCSIASPIKIQQFSGGLGFHFDHLGTVDLATDEWKLIVYYNLDPYWKDVANTADGIDTMTRLCNRVTKGYLCKPVIEQCQYIMGELKDDNELLRPHSSHNRSKRGAFNIVGHIANSLFGLLDADYAEEIAKNLDSTQENQEYLLSMLRNRTSIIDSTINVINTNQKATNSAFQSITTEIQRLTNHINRTNDEIQQLTILQTFMSVSIQMLFMVSELQRMQSSMIDVITHTRQGKIPLLILPPTRLRQELIAIKNHLPATIQLPVKPDDLHYLYQLMEVKGRTLEKYIIFQFSVPLITTDNLELLRVMAIPSSINGTLIAIQPTAPFLAITLHRDQFYTMDDRELSACKVTNSSTYICKALHPLYRRMSNISTCEVNLINNMPMTTACKLRKLANHFFWAKLASPNTWLFAFNEGININLACGNQASSQMLEGSGIVHLQANCIIKHDWFTIRGLQSHTGSTNLSYTKLVHLPHLDNIENAHLYTNQAIVYQQIHLKELKAIQAQLNIPELANLPHRVKQTDTHQFAVSYLGLLIGIILIIILVSYKITGQLRICRSKPTPRPRQRCEPAFEITVE